MTDTPQADALLTALISGTPQIEAFAGLTEAHEREKALHVLLAMLSDPDQWRCAQAVRALHALGDQRAVEPLRNSLETIGSRNVFEATTNALVALGDLDAILLLLGHRLTNSNMYTHLMKFNTDDLLRVLGDLLNHPDEQIRFRVLFCLQWMKYPGAIPLFIQALKDESRNIRGKAAHSLTGAAEAVPALQATAADPDPFVRQEVAQALGESGDQRAIHVLLPRLRDGNQDVRFHAAFALGKLGHPAGRALIQTYLVTRHHSASLSNLHHALKALKALGEPLVPQLLALNQRVPLHRAVGYETQLLIVDLLAEAGDPAALPVLECLAQGNYKAVQQAAQQAINAIKARG